MRPPLSSATTGAAGAANIHSFPAPPQYWFGARHNVFCCDYAVGARWRDRKAGIAPQYSAYRLAALRWPEKTLVFDDGETVATL